MTITTVARDVADLQRLAPALIRELGQTRVVIFDAPMGAGKTTLVAALAQALGADPSQVASPTFAIVNDYDLPGDHHLFHFDLYRLRKPQELDDIGFPDYLGSGDWCMIEWPDLARSFLPPATATIAIAVGDNEVRKITLQTP